MSLSCNLTRRDKAARVFVSERTVQFWTSLRPRLVSITLHWQDMRDPAIFRNHVTSSRMSWSVLSAGWNFWLHGWLWHLRELSSGLLGVIAECIMTCEADPWGRRKLINHVVSEICQNYARLWLMRPRRRREDCGSSCGWARRSSDSSGFRLVAQKTALLQTSFHCQRLSLVPNLRLSDSDESPEVTFVCAPSHGEAQASTWTVTLDQLVLDVEEFA